MAFQAGEGQFGQVSEVTYGKDTQLYSLSPARQPSPSAQMQKTCGESVLATHSTSLKYSGFLPQPCS